MPGHEFGSVLYLRHLFLVWACHSTRVPSASMLMLSGDNYISTIPGPQGI